MGEFRQFALRMLRRPGALSLAVVFAFISALSLGGGLLGIAPILQAILGDGATLPEIVREKAGGLASATGARIPEAIIAALPEDRFESVAWLIAVVIALTLVGATANFLHAYFALTVTTNVVADVRRELFRRVVHLPLGALHGRVSDTLSRITSDTTALLGGLNALVSKALAQATKALAAVAVALAVEWRIALAAVAVGPLLYIVIRKLGKRVKRASRGAMQAQARLLAVATEAMQGARVVKVFTAERRELGRFERENRMVVREQFRARTAKALASPFTETISILAVALLAMAAAKAIIDGDLDPSRFITALAALAVAGGALKPLTSVVQEIQTSEAAAQRIAEVLREPVEPARRVGGRIARLARHARTIDFERVTLRYEGAERPALADVSLVVRHGETVAFVGPNGCGKTSLLSLVPRLYTPASGRILIDGVDIAGVSLASLRRQIAVVTQEVVLFHTTIAENIAYGAVGASREAIVAAAQRAGADAFIRRRTGAYDAVVGEQGVTLSGGERQKLALARAVLRDPAILILDEATSMIDAESEQTIAEALAAFAEGRTCLIVAHRLATVARADRIVVMDSGRIVDVGKHEELLGRCAFYRTLASGRFREDPVAAAAPAG